MALDYYPATWKNKEWSVFHTVHFTPTPTVNSSAIRKALNLLRYYNFIKMSIKDQMRDIIWQNIINTWKYGENVQIQYILCDNIK